MLNLRIGVKFFLPQARADDVVLGDEGIHVLERHGVDVDVRELPFDQFVGAVAGLAGLAVDHRVVEGRDVAGRFPNARVHQDGRVDPDVGRGFLDEFLPPEIADVPLHLRAQGAVVPSIGKAAVNGRALKHEPGVLKMGRDLFKRVFVRHHRSPFLFLTKDVE